jgi:uncharacterized protein YqgC (DUF456 family)
MADVIAAIACFILMLLGLAGVVLPFLPGVPLAWVGLFIYALVTGFDKISIAATVVFFVVMLITLAIDFVAPMLGAKKYRASRWGIIGVFIGFIAGIFILGLWGVVLGPFLGALTGELLGNRKPGRALRSSLGALIGFLTGAILKIAVILTMLGFFIAALFS